MHELRDELWKSQLCTDHKLLQLAVLSYMNKDRPFAYPGYANLGMKASMSRTKLSRLLQDLTGYDWLQTLPLPADLQRQGRNPRCYYLPRRDLLPQVPPHCRKKSRITNLKQARK